MLVSIGVIFLFLYTGYRMISIFFNQKEFLHRIWLGSAFGLLLLLWIPALFSFLFTFQFLSQILAILLCVLGLGITFLPKFRRGGAENKIGKQNYRLLIIIGVIVLFCTFLWYTHTLRPVNGALHTGQSTFGDMSLHLGLITSIAEQGTFPPFYSILPDTKVGYPFLCDSISSTFYILGASLRAAYILPMIPALFLFLLGLYFFYEEVLMSNIAPALLKKAAYLSFFLFLFGGGFGFSYFFDHAKSSEQLKSLFTGFYTTPTNFVDQNIIWVNVICDMLIPQRATLFGWALLMPCLYLLYLMFQKKQISGSIPLLLAIFAGSLPLIHTHSFLALGVISICTLLFVLSEQGMKECCKRFLPYGFLTFLLALPQLILFTFRQSGGTDFVRFTLHWANQSDQWIWFYVKNMGLLFLFLIPAVWNANQKLRKFGTGALLLFLLCEFMVFQPNNYDNNKLIFISFLFACFFVARFLVLIYEQVKQIPGVKMTSILILTVFFLSGTLSLIRETVSDYELFSKEQTEAAQWIQEHTKPNATFLTAGNHNNAVSALTGRNIVLGSDSFLYFHGLDTSSRYKDVYKMFTEPGAIAEYAPLYTIDYIYFSSYEQTEFGDGEQLIHAPIVYQNEEVTIYQIQ